MLGAELRQARKGMGMTLADLEQASGVDIGTLSRIENDVRHPRTDTLRKICQALGLPSPELMVRQARRRATAINE